MPFKHRQLANMISFSRIIGVACIFWFTPYKTNFYQILVALIYTVICFTDLLDGWVARRFSQVTDVGKILDPLADKILVLVLLPLLEMQVITSFPVFIILAREFAIMALRVAAAKHGNIVPATFSGKIKTAITLPVCGILFGRVAVTQVPNLPWIFEPINLLAEWIYSWPAWFMSLLIWSMVAVTVWSFLDYFGDFIWEEYAYRAKQNAKQAKKTFLTLVPNVITFMNLACGLGGICAAFIKRYDLTVVLVLSGMLFDALDGKVARRLKVSSVFGEKLDSKADLVCFGLAPAVMIFTIMVNEGEKSHLLWGIFLALSYFSAVFYRLRRFNTSGHSPYFEGLPSPVGAACVVLGAISSYISTLSVFVPLVFLVGFLMVSRIPYPHLDIATRQTWLRYIKNPTFILFIATILILLDQRIGIHFFFVHELLFGITWLYIFYPITAQLGKLLKAQHTN